MTCEVISLAFYREKKAEEKAREAPPLPDPPAKKKAQQTRTSFIVLGLATLIFVVLLR